MKSLLIIAIALAISPASAQETVAQQTPPWDISLNALKNALERPAFSPDRKAAAAKTPLIAAETAPNAILPEVDNPVLIGTVMGPAPVAVFRLQGKDEAVRVHLNSEVQGWTLKSVQAGKALLMRRADNTTISIKINNNPIPTKSTP